MDSEVRILHNLRSLIDYRGCSNGQGRKQDSEILDLVSVLAEIFLHKQEKNTLSFLCHCLLAKENKLHSYFSKSQVI